MTQHQPWQATTFSLMAGERFRQIETELLDAFTDPSVDEILVNACRGLSIVRGQSVAAKASPFETLEAMILWLQEFASRMRVRLDPLCGQAGGLWEPEIVTSSYRWHCLLPPLSQDGPLFSLRRHRFAELTTNNFVAENETLDDLQKHFRSRKPLLIAGPTASGKSSLLTALLRDQASDERVFIIESLPELPLASPNWVRLTERRANLEGIGAVSIERLIQESLRLRPDRLVLGEIRSHEAGAFLEALTTGHGGVAATIHADSAEAAIFRLLQLASLSGARTISSWRDLLSNFDLGVAILKRGEPPRLESFTSTSLLLLNKDL